MAFQNASYTDARYSVLANVGRDLYNITQVNSLDHTLLKLESARMDASTRTECLPGTRTDILQYILAWAFNQSTEQRVLWLHGLAGSGKSTLSTTIANSLQEQGRLGAFVFFNRDVEERSQSSNVIRTLAYQLAMFDARIAATVAAFIDATPRVAHSPLRLQFIHLLVKPLSSLPMTEAPVVIVLDALDECGSADDRKALLAILAAESLHLPHFIRIIITSRTELDIRTAFRSKPHIHVLELDLSSNNNIEDISSFLRSRMEEIRVANASLALAHDWPGDATISALVARAAGLFVWASTACRFIDGHDPRKRLDTLLRHAINTKAESALDTLYATALESVGRWDDEDFRADFCSIMGTILVAKNPISDATIDELLCLDRPSSHTISRLGCVLRWSRTEPMRIIHPSFADFLTDRLRCGSDAWYIHSPSHDERLAVQCIRRLDAVLKMNICNLTLIPSPVKAALPEAISYACNSWIDHICLITEGSDAVGDMLEKFLFEHLLHWLEAISILKKSRMTITLLYRLLVWFHQHLPQRHRLHELIEDASRLVQTFASSIEEHPLLVYLSALPFTPVHTLLHKTFIDHDFPYIVGGFNTSWPPLLQILRGHRGAVRSMAFFPNGTRLVSSSDDNTIRVWDATSGADVLGPLIGHRRSVKSVAISHDGRRILSGGSDSTIRLWDATTGIEALPTLQGHTDRVYSVAFSPDGTRIASGSADQSVRVWNATSGSMVCAVLRGHEGEVHSVAFTADGRRIVSCSSDKSIRIWDATSGAHILYPLRGHNHGIRSVTVSQDGKHITSDSSDRTIRVWDTTVSSQSLVLRVRGRGSPSLGGVARYVLFCLDGRHVAAIVGSFGSRLCVWDVISGAQVYVSAVLKPMRSLAASPSGEQFAIGYRDGTVELREATFSGENIPNSEAHCGGIATIAFSPDGKQIAWCSAPDLRIHFWDTQSAGESMEPFEGHCNYITSLTFSPNGKLIASGSWDTTIRVWDTVSGAETLPAIRGHTNGVMCVEFSPNGTQLASGSGDSTVRLWSAISSVRIISTLRGHQHCVVAVAFSPDGTRIVSGCEQGFIRMWNVTSGAQTLRFSTQHWPGPTSLGFSADGRYILVKSGNTVQVWDTSKARFTLAPSYLHKSCALKDPIIITPDAWIVDVAARRFLGKLPSIVSIHRFAASKTSIAFTTEDRGSTIFIMHLPPNMLAGPMTWDPAV